MDFKDVFNFVYHEHPVIFWIVTTAILNAIVRAWPRLQNTAIGRAFSWLCLLIGADAPGLLKVMAAGAGARALGLAATGLGTTPGALASLASPPSSPPPQDRPTEPPSDGPGRRL